MAELAFLLFHGKISEKLGNVRFSPIIHLTTLIESLKICFKASVAFSHIFQTLLLLIQQHFQTKSELYGHKLPFLAQLREIHEFLGYACTKRKRAFFQRASARSIHCGGSLQIRKKMMKESFKAKFFFLIFFILRKTLREKFYNF